MSKQGSVTAATHREVRRENRRLQAEIKRLTANLEHYEDTLCENVWLEARVEELEGALHKIRTEPGDTRDCRYIAGHALAATGQEGEK